MKRSVYILVSLIILVLVALLLLREPGPEAADAPAAAARQPVLSQTEKTTVTVYYLTRDGACLLPLSIDVQATTEVARVALEQLLAGPPDDSALPSMPPNVRLNDIYSIYQTVYVDLTAEFLDVPPERTQLALDALAATVLPLVADGYQMQLLIDGNGHAEINGVDTGTPCAEPLLNLDSDVALPEGVRLEDCRMVVYYHPDADLRYLVPHTMPCWQEDGVSDAEALQLACARILPACMSVQALIVEGGLAHLDLLYDATVAYRGGAAYEQAWLNALVATACGLPQIDALQLTLDNTEIETLPKGAAAAGQLKMTQPINYLL